MALNCGIVGLPNVGKSTLFSAITAAPAEAANYPFCTIDPNVGVVEVPDKRLDKISELIKPQKTIPTVIEFVDIAGLVKGASKGEGLGNKFLANIREVNAIIHVVRCFENDNIVHVDGSIDPLRDIATIEMELAFADLETVQKRREKNSKSIRSSDKKIVENAKIMDSLLQRLESHLDEGKPARTLEMSDKEIEVSKDLQLITAKKVLYCCNVDEDSAADGNEYVEMVKKHAEDNGSEAIFISAQVESEISTLETKEERDEFLSDLGLEESGLDKLIKAAYRLLDLKTYFTAGEKEARAWTFKNGFTAPQCAGVIHTDFERGFIKAEIYHCEDLFQHESESGIRDAGKIRMEGKDYIMKDGDVCHFRFNV